ncbi:MAG: carboxypeptidase regulatory-like domain-containing protein, partial [Marmoricola sp.]
MVNPSSPITGTVRDAAGPVAGATVRFKASAVATTTDATGRFTLPRPAGRARVT